MASTNIKTALERIKTLRDQLTEHYIELGNIPFDEKVLVKSTSTLSDVVDAYNSIVKASVSAPEGSFNSTSKTYSIDNTQTVIFSPGYYSESFTVTGLSSDADAQEAAEKARQALLEQIKNTADLVTPDNALVGTKVPVVSENEDGTLSISYEDGKLASVSLNGASEEDTDGNKKVVVTANGATLTTDIPYQENNTLTVTVKNSEQGKVVESPTLPAGYYPATPTVVIKDDGTDIGEINVEISKDATSAGSVTPTEGFDYLKEVKIAEGSAKVTAEISGNKVVLTPAVTKGWIETVSLKNSDDEDITEIEIPVVEAGGAAKASVVSEDGKDDKVVVTIPAGYYSGETTVVVSNEDGTPISVVPEISDTDISETEDNDDYLIVIPAGYNSSSLTVSLGKSTLSTPTDNTITSQKVTISTSKGYTEGEEKELTVQDAVVEISYNTESNSILINTAASETSPTLKPGWFSSKEIALSDDLVDTIVSDRGAELEINSAALETITGTQDYTANYKKVSVDVTDLILEIDEI